MVNYVPDYVAGVVVFALGVGCVIAIVPGMALGWLIFT